MPVGNELITADADLLARAFRGRPAVIEAKRPRLKRSLPGGGQRRNGAKRTAPDSREAPSLGVFRRARGWLAGPARSPRGTRAGRCLTGKATRLRDKEHTARSLRSLRDLRPDAYGSPSPSIIRHHRCGRCHPLQNSCRSETRSVQVDLAWVRLMERSSTRLPRQDCHRELAARKAARIIGLQTSARGLHPRLTTRAASQPRPSAARASREPQPSTYIHGPVAGG